MRYLWLYTGVLVSLFAMVVLSLGGGLWGAEQSIGHWTGKLFQGICHQMPERSFTFNDVPMAVNSRCFGIFLGFLTGWAIIPFLKGRTCEKKWSIWFLLFAGMLQIIDVTGNFIHLWENTTISRAFLGGIFGIAGPMVVSGQFFNN